MINAILLHDWNIVENVFASFEGASWSSDPSYVITDKGDVEILLASYTYEDYFGKAFVLFRKKSDGSLYEVNGSHCSCYGLEGQWSPEETNVEALRFRLEKGNLGRDSWSKQSEFADELTVLLDALVVDAT